MKKKPNRIWKFFKVLVIIFISLLIIISILPYFFKNQIMDSVKTEINQQVEARIDFKDFSLSLIRNFPHFNCNLEGISVVGINEFEGDTLAYIHSFSMTIDLLSVIEGDKYRIRKITIEQPDLLLKVNEVGKANWDIAKKTEEEVIDPASEEPSDFVVTLKKLEIINANLSFIDQPSNLWISLDGLHHTLSGDFGANNTKINSLTLINSATITEGGVKYFNNSVIEFKAIIDADLKNEIYTFMQNSLKINELILKFNGSLAMVNEDINVTMTFQAPQNKFKNFLSLIPAIYAKEFQGIEAAGKLAVDGYLKGVYNSQNLPSFRLNIGVEDAMFKYPDLPYPVKDINLDVLVSNSGGDINNTEIDISKFHLKILQNPVNIRLKLQNLMEDPLIDGEIKGILDLAVIKEVYPLDEGEDIQGKITMNVATQGKLSSIENEMYDDFKAIGSVLVQGFNYKNNDFQEGMFIRNAQLNFSPAYLDLVNLQFEYKDSDIHASGKIEQYLGYALGGKTLLGNFITTSRLFNVNSFMVGMGEDNTGASDDTTEFTAIKVPPNVDFQLASSFDKLLYDDILMENVSGTIQVKDETIFLNDLNADVYEGTLLVNGSYSTLDRTNPVVDMAFDIRDISITDAYASFEIMQKLAPVAEHVLGRFSTEMAFKTDLNQEMMPVLATMMGDGALNTSRISVENVKSLDMLSSTLNIEEFKKMDLNPLNMLFTIEEGKVNVKPFELKSDHFKANVSGWTSFDQTINYVMNMEIPRELFGTQANAALDDLVSKANVTGTNFSLGETIDVDVLFTGTATDPKISTNLANIGKSIIDDTKKQLEEELKKKQEEAKMKASEEAKKILEDADNQAQKIIAEAQIKADEIIMAAEAAAIEVRAEGDKQANKLMDEAKGKGTLAELGAKKAADELKKESNKRANQVVSEASKQSQNVMNQARAHAKEVKDDAQKRVDALNQ